MTVSPASVKARCKDPIIQAMLDADVQLLIDESERHTARGQWGESKADDGVIYLTAHMCLMSAKALAGQMSNVKGPLTGETVGPLSRSFAGPQAVPFSQLWYTLTTWGAMYWGLMSTVLSQRTDFDGTCW